MTREQTFKEISEAKRQVNDAIAKIEKILKDLNDWQRQIGG